MGFTSRWEMAAFTGHAVHFDRQPPPGVRWHIATAANRAYTGLLLNWLHHLKPHVALVQSVTVLADDAWTLTWLGGLAGRLRAELRCELTAAQTSSNISNAASFGEPAYRTLMAARPAQLLALLEGAHGSGSNSPWVWCDVDAVFIGSPFAELPLHAAAGAASGAADLTFDLHQLMDEPRHGSGRATHDPRLSAGFVALRNSPDVRALLRAWADDMALKRRTNASGWSGNQNAYRRVWLRFRRRLRTRALPGDRFLNGGTYFINASRWPRALLAHATHVAGLARKVALLEFGGLWRCAEAEGDCRAL